MRISDISGSVCGSKFLTLKENSSETEFLLDFPFDMYNILPFKTILCKFLTINVLKQEMYSN